MSKIINETNSTMISGNKLIRSHSHSNVNKPSQDLLGLTLHEISDPIDTPAAPFTDSAQKPEQEKDVPNSVIEISKEVEPESHVVADGGSSCNTSKG